MNKNNFTIFSDASFCMHTKVAGYAYWARDSVLKFQGARSDTNVTKSSDAEIFAVVWAIYSISKKIDLTKRHVIIVTDALCAKIFLESSSLGEGRLKEAKKSLLELKNGLNFSLQINHVKGHSYSWNKSERNWVNDFCDRKAKEQMRTLRDRILKSSGPLAQR